MPRGRHRADPVPSLASLRAQAPHRQSTRFLCPYRCALQAPSRHCSLFLLATIDARCRHHTGIARSSLVPVDSRFRHRHLHPVLDRNAHQREGARAGAWAHPQPAAPVLTVAPVNTVLPATAPNRPPTTRNHPQHWHQPRIMVPIYIARTAIMNSIYPLQASGLAGIACMRVGMQGRYRALPPGPIGLRRRLGFAQRTDPLPPPSCHRAPAAAALGQSTVRRSLFLW